MRKEAKAAYAEWNLHLRDRRNSKLNKLCLPISHIERIEYQCSKRIRRSFIRKPPPSSVENDWKESSTVFNLSGIDHSTDELKLLSRGPSFFPTPRRVNRNEVLDGLECYLRRLRLKEFFLDDDDEGNDAEKQSDVRVQSCFLLPSTWMPPKGRDAALETYIRKFRADVQHQLEVNHHKRCRDNLASNERIALHRHHELRDVVIKPADKGSAVVVLSKEDYVNEAERQLNNHGHYTRLNVDPTHCFAAEIKSAIHSMFTNGKNR